LRHRHQNAGDVERAGERDLRQRNEIRREDPKGGVAQQQRQPEGRKNLRQHGPAHHMADEREVDDDAEHEQRKRGGKAERLRPPRPSHTTTSSATYMPSMTNSPWAKLMKFITPQISVRPEENKA